jgi:hypothetical protein
LLSFGMEIVKQITHLTDRSAPASGIHLLKQGHELLEFTLFLKLTF